MEEHLQTQFGCLTVHDLHEAHLSFAKRTLSSPKKRLSDRVVYHCCMLMFHQIKNMYIYISFGHIHAPLAFSHGTQLNDEGLEDDFLCIKGTLLSQDTLAARKTGDISCCPGATSDAFTVKSNPKWIIKYHYHYIRICTHIIV